MDPTDEARLAGLEARCHELATEKAVYWVRATQARVNEDNYLWLRDVWWDQRKPPLSRYAADELDDAIAAYRRGEQPKPPRIARFNEWRPEEGKGAGVILRNIVGSIFQKE